MILCTFAIKILKTRQNRYYSKNKLKKMQRIKSKNGRQTRTIPFDNMAQLFDDLKALYPAETIVTVINLDDRDEEYIPYISNHIFNGYP